MSDMLKVKVLRTVRVADGTAYGREIVKGTDDEVPAGLFDGLKAEKYVEALKAGKKTEVLRDDGPTIAEYVAAGYPASKYPPEGYASRSTPEEIEAAVTAEDAAKALEAMRADLTKMTNAQLHELADAEKIAVETDDNKATMVDKIMAARTAPAAA
ncbi:hypothetical protein [Allomesorhizobium alhagi]|uniref:Uncharacterized protein n=1 Tax=Mesorhizobium alhagi CCNWXJ12-2 TaxID=1107882 RepID=H0HQU4_9HYPH|nr:hypothetical protein [Mesorhizobium alhagi]EHK56908.1 hypothetical protein MAXJ12_12622 [Mesorhizobium alhagi CCNWXJ12-2]